MLQHPDIKYIYGILEGNDALLKEIYDKYFFCINNFIEKHGGQVMDTQDVFQEAIIVLYKKGQEEHFILTSSFKTLLYSICRNIWLKKLNRLKITTVTVSDTEDIVDVHNFETTITKQTRYKLYREKYEQLGTSCQKLLQLFFEKKSMINIAQIMGFKSVLYARKRKFQCKEKLVKLIEQDERYKELL